MTIVQGDNGITIPFSTNMDLTNSIVSVYVQRGADLLSKTPDILDISKGDCQFTLLSSDLIMAGLYRYQWTINYNSGVTKSGKTYDLFVESKLTGGTPPNNGGGDITVIVDGGTF